MGWVTGSLGVSVGGVFGFEEGSPGCEGLDGSDGELTARFFAEEIQVG